MLRLSSFHFFYYLCVTTPDYYFPMKRIKEFFYRIAYRIASRLSDISGGARFFVRWKVALAAVILGFSAVSLTGCPRTTCYDAPAPEPTCYDPVAPEAPCPEGGEEARYDASEPRYLDDSAPADSLDQTSDDAR